MLMSEEEKERYRAENRIEIEGIADRVFTQEFGRSYSDSDMKKARGLPHGSSNGSSRPEDALEHIRQEFPSLFNED